LSTGNLAGQRAHSESLRRSTTAVTVPTTLVAAMIAACIMVLWQSATDHALYTPDEGRYGAVSVHMANGGSWLVPELDGHPHLSKPPLTYWAQAACIRLLGPTEAAARMPSLVAATLTMLLVAAAAHRLGGMRVAMTSLGTLCLMPMFMLLGRLATTDSLLAFFWTASLLLGAASAQTGRARHAALMWTAVAAGLMTKGPLALVPPALVAGWLLLGRRGADLRRLHIGAGLPAALGPVAAWAILVVLREPQAVSIWLHETVARAAGTGDHAEPMWFFIPVFLAGLFPATAMLVLPGLNGSWRQAWASLRSGRIPALLSLAVIVPLVMFSLISGKLVSYLLPLCPPLAILNGLMLERWLDGTNDRAVAGWRPPDVIVTSSICVLLATAAAIAAAVWTRWPVGWLALPLLVIPGAYLWSWMIWKRGPRARALGMAAIFVVSMASWMWAFELEDEARRPSSEADLVSHLRLVTGSPTPVIATYGFSDPALTFYSGRATTSLATGRDVLEVAGIERVVVLADAEQWDALAQRHPRATAGWVHRGDWPRWLDRTTYVLTPDPSATALQGG